MKFLLVVTLFFGTFLVLIPHVVYLLLKLFALFFHFKVAYKAFGLTSLALLLCWTVVVLYGYYVGRYDYEVKRWVYEDSRVPVGFDGYRIVHISDLHMDGWKGRMNKLEEIVATINAQKPDLICFTGDLASLSPKELEPFLSTLGKLKAVDGVVSVMGNHDYFPYARVVSDSIRWQYVQQLVRMERQALGWHLLMNESRCVKREGDSIAIIGVENQSVGAHPVVQRGRLSQAMQGTDGMFRVLLSHDPSHWRKEVVGKTDIPLTLSGHTHAMQFRVCGLTPSCLFYPECDGLYMVDNQSLYVNIGLGGTIPMRVGAKPEITVVTLRKIES